MREIREGEQSPDPNQFGANMSLAVIIPTYERPHLLRSCLERVVPQVAHHPGAQIYVCDDSRSNSTRAMIEGEFPTVIWHQGPQRGPGPNRNMGARVAEAAWLVFLDDDCIPRADLIATYLNAIEGEDDLSQVFLMGSTHSEDPQHSLLWESPHNPVGEFFISCNFAVSKQLFLEVGGFDESYSPLAIFEDTELEARVRATGLEIRPLPEAAVDHPLRPLAPANKLANRWESRVISTLNYGADVPRLLLHLPRHVALVTLSRYYHKKLTLENLKAAPIFVAEFSLFLLRLPRWVRRHRFKPRNEFWKQQAAQGKLPPRFGL